MKKRDKVELGKSFWKEKSNKCEQNAVQRKLPVKQSERLRQRLRQRAARLKKDNGNRWKEEHVDKYVKKE